MTSLNDKEAVRSFDRNRTITVYLSTDEEPTDRYYGAALPILCENRASNLNSAVSGHHAK